MTVPARRERLMFADLMDWLEGEFPALPIMRPFTGGHLVRVEDYVSEGEYVVRAELPGIDPEKDVDITVEDGVLTVKAERREAKKEGGRSEFRYGLYSQRDTTHRCRRGERRRVLPRWHPRSADAHQGSDKGGAQAHRDREGMTAGRRIPDRPPLTREWRRHAVSYAAASPATPPHHPYRMLCSV